MKKISRIFSSCTAAVAALYIWNPGSLSAQQIPLNNHYMVQPFAFSPAYAGLQAGAEAFALFRQDWVGFDGAPETRSFLASGQINDKMGIGGSISSQSMGIFRTLSANISYAYHLKVHEDHRLSFGLTAGMIDQNIELANGTAADQQDPLAAGNAQVVHGISPDIGFSGIYQWKKLQASFYAPRLLEDETEDLSGVQKNNKALFTLKRHGFGMLTYRHDLKNGIALEPFMLARRTLKSPLLFDMALKTSFKDKAWLGLGYRKGSIMMLSLGASHKGFLLNYGYEFSGDGLLAQSSGTHEISLGYRFGAGKSTDAEVPEPTRKTPYYKWVN